MATDWNINTNCFVKISSFFIHNIRSTLIASMSLFDFPVSSGRSCWFFLFLFRSSLLYLFPFEAFKCQELPVIKCSGAGALCVVINKLINSQLTSRTSGGVETRVKAKCQAAPKVITNWLPCCKCQSNCGELDEYYYYYYYWLSESQQFVHGPGKLFH